MPIYEYHCKSCGHQFDALRSFTEADKPVACENCGEKETRRVISTLFAYRKGNSTKSNSSTCGNCSGGSCSSCKH